MASSLVTTMFAAPTTSRARFDRCKATTRRRHVRGVTVTVNSSNDDHDKNDVDGGGVASSPQPPKPSTGVSQTGGASDANQAEALLLSSLRFVEGRGAKASAAEERAIADAVTRLETGGGGMSDPATRPEIQGTWKLLYTSKSSFDIKNPLGSRVDGTAPGIEGFFTSIFGDKAGRGGGGSRGIGLWRSGVGGNLDS